MSETFKKRETLINPDYLNRIEIIKKQLDEIKKIETKKITTNEVNQTIDDKTFLWKRGWKFIVFLGELWIDLTKYGLNAIKDASKEIFNWLIPEDVQEIVKDNLNWFVKWYNEKTKNDEIIKLVDEIYMSWFSIRKNGNRYIIKDKNGKIIKKDNNNDLLEIFNIENNNISEVLDKVLASRLLTAKWIDWVLKIKKHLNIDTMNGENIKTLKPEDLANAYLKEYKIKDSNGKIISLNDPALEKTLKKYKLKNHNPKLENDIIDYILMTKDNVFDKDDMWFLQNALKEYKNITTNTISNKTKFKEVIKWTTNNFIDILKNPWEALSKINNPISMLWLIAALGYWLFFSENKKTFWMSILWIYWADALVDIVDWDKNKWLFDLAKKWNEKIFEILESDLKNKPYIKQFTDNPNETKIILDLTTVKWSTLFENIDIDNDWSISIKNINNLIKSENQEEYIEVFKSKAKFELALKEMIQTFLKFRKTWEESLLETKQRLEKKYNTSDYPNVRFGEILLVELSWNIKNTNTSTTKNSIHKTPILTSTATLSNIPNNIQTELNKIEDIQTKKSISENISNIIKWNGAYTKEQLIADIDINIWIPFISNTERQALKQLKIEINNL